MMKMDNNYTLLRTWLTAALLVLGLVFCPAMADDDEEQIPQQILVELESFADPDVVAADFGLEVIERLPALDLYVFFDPLARDEDAVAGQLEQDPRVDDAEGHRLFDNPEGGQRTVPELDQVASIADLGLQPSFGSIGGPSAIGRHTGRGVLVAVLDSGLSLGHPAIAPVLAGRSFDIVDGASTAHARTDGIDNDGDGSIDESIHHGTFVSALIALSAPGARLLPIRVLDADGRGSSFDVAQGILTAIQQGADVINLSLGMVHQSSVLETAVQRALSAGVVVVAAAGNRDSEPTDYPATLPGVVSVASVDDAFAKTTFSSFGSSVDLTTPGEQILSAYGDDQYARWSGTSFSAPFTAGAVALLLERYPGLTPAEVSDALRQTTQPDSAGGFAGLLGDGVLDMDALTTIVTDDATSLTLERVGGATRLSWSPLLGVGSFDLVRGDVQALAASPGGDIDLGAVVCVDNDLPSDPIRVSTLDSVLPAPGQAFFYAFRDRQDPAARGYGVVPTLGSRHPSSGDCPDPS